MSAQSCNTSQRITQGDFEEIREMMSFCKKIVFSSVQ